MMKVYTNVDITFGVSRIISDDWSTMTWHSADKGFSTINKTISTFFRLEIIIILWFYRDLHLQYIIHTYWIRSWKERLFYLKHRDSINPKKK